MIIIRAIPCFVLTSNKGYALNYVGCFLLIQVVFGYRYCYTVIMRWHCIVSLLDSMLILLTVNRATRLLCVMYCRFILVEASMDIEYNCVCGYAFLRMTLRSWQVTIIVLGCSHKLLQIDDITFMFH